METTKRRSRKKFIIILVIVAALILAPFLPTLVCEIMTAVHFDEFVSVIEDYDETVAFVYKYKVISYGTHYAKVYRYTTGDNEYGICLGEVKSFTKVDSEWRYDKDYSWSDIDSWDTMWSANGSADRVVWQYWWHIFYEYHITMIAA